MANKALHLTAVPLRSTTAGELGRWAGRRKTERRAGPRQAQGRSVRRSVAHTGRFADDSAQRSRQWSRRRVGSSSIAADIQPSTMHR